jgi:hypothetical protein
MQMQPLAGTEFVVNGASAKQWGPALEAINGGMSPADLAGAFSAQPMSASVDQLSLEAAVMAGLSRARLAINLDGRTLYGAVVDAGKAQRAPFVTRRG